MKQSWIIVLIGALLVAACEKKPQKMDAGTPQPQANAAASPTPRSSTAVPPMSPVRQSFTGESIMRGAALYKQQCLQCHGPEAQGHPDWQTPSGGAFTAAPPLNGTGNAWKRKKRDMITIIKGGARRNGIPAMPAYKDRLSDQDIEDVIRWFQVLWPPQLYERWLNANMDPDGPKG